MPAHQRSLHLTEIYRQRMVALRKQSEAAARTGWGRVNPGDIESSYEPWISSIGAAVALRQRAAVQLSNGYLAAFVISELGHAVPTPPVEAAGFVGVDRGGQPLTEALRSPLVGVQAALKEGKPGEEAMAIGLDRALRMVSLATDTAARNSLSVAMEANPRIEGWRRAIKGTCDACLGAASDTILPPGTPLDIHPFCECVAEPAVSGLPDSFPRPTGTEIFNGMSEEKQDAQFGPERAKLLRDGKVTLRDLILVSPMATEPDFITAKPLDQLPVELDAHHH